MRKFRCLGSYKYRNPYFLVQSLLEPNIKNSLLILDAGCGGQGGIITKIPSNIQGVGLDVSREAIRKSVRISRELGKSNLSFLMADVQKMPFRENTFDIIACQDVLEHVRGKQNVIDDIAFSLKRGGKILICTSNCFNPGMLIDEILPKKVSKELVNRFRRTREYDRYGRLNPWGLNAVFLASSLKLKKMLMVGGGPWIQHSIIRYFWIVFDKLTSIGFLKNFKEIMIAIAEK